MNWKLGNFIQKQLEIRGGRRAGWHQSRLAELSGLSATQIGWIVHGETSHKKGPPALQVDTIISLAKALGLKEQVLIDAYKGKDPDIVDEPSEDVRQILAEFIKQLPNSFLVETKNPVEIFETLIAGKDKDKIQELCQESMRRKKDG